MALNKIKVNDTTTVNTGVVYDITKATGQSYDSLSAALGTDGNNVPSEVREGGMSIRFVQTSDNKYVQYRLMATSFSTTSSDWQGIDDGLTLGSDNLVNSKGVIEGDIAVESLIDGKQVLSAPLDGYNRIPIQTLKAKKEYIIVNEGDAPIYVSNYAFFNSDGTTVVKQRIDGSQGASDNIPKGGWETFYVTSDVVEINIRFRGFNGIFSIKEAVNRIEELQAKDTSLQEQIDTNAFESNQKKQFKGSAWTEHEYSMSSELTYTITQISSGSIIGVQAKDSDGNNVGVSGFTTLRNIGDSCNIKVAKDATILRVYHDSSAAFEIKNNIQNYILDAIASINETDNKQNESIAELNASVYDSKEFSGSGWSEWTKYDFRRNYAYKITNISTNSNSTIKAFDMRVLENGTYRTITYKGDSITNLIQGQTATIIPNGNATEFRAYFDGGGKIEISGTLDITNSVYDLLDGVQIQEGYSSKDQIKHQVIVAKDGADGHFATIAEAYASITDSSYTNQYEVIVYPGKYNELRLVPPPFTHTHGLAPNSVIVSSEGVNPVSTLPVFEQQVSSSKLSNMTIESHNGYCIHYDEQLTGQVVMNENLRLVKAATPNNTWYVVGGGSFQLGTKYIWKNCVFISLGSFGQASCHTNGNLVNDNLHLVFDGCSFINCNPRIGSVGGFGHCVVELTNCVFSIGVRGLEHWYSPIRNIDNPSLYRFNKNEWQIIGGGNKNLSMWLSQSDRASGKTIRLVADYPITISGTAASVIFGYNPTANNIKTARLDCTLTSEYYIADEQAGYSGYSELRDVFQLWKRLGDCSTTNKTLTVTVNNVSKTYTFTENYLSTKTAQTTIIAAMQAVLDNVTIESITQSGYGYENVNTSDVQMIKVMSDDILKGEFVTLRGEKATSSTSIKDIAGVACEDKPHGEYIKAWASAFRFDTDYADGEYGLDANGALDANAVNKIGFVKGYNFYLY